MCRSIFIQSFSALLLMLMLLLLLEKINHELDGFHARHPSNIVAISIMSTSKCRSRIETTLASDCRLRKVCSLSTLGWWNWQTRTFEGRMPKGLRVQVPPRAESLSR